MEQKLDFTYAAKVLSEARQKLKEILIDFYEENEQLMRQLWKHQLIDVGFLLGILAALRPEEIRAALEFVSKEVVNRYGIRADRHKFLEFCIGGDFDPIKAIEERRKQREQTQENSGNQA